MSEHGEEVQELNDETHDTAVVTQVDEQNADQTNPDEKSIEDQQREYSDFVRLLRGTSDPKALNRFDYRPKNPQMWCGESRYTTKRIEVPARDPGNIARLSFLARPVKEIPEKRKPSEPRTRLQLPELTAEERVKVDRLAKPSAHMQNQPWKEPEKEKYEGRHLPPVDHDTAQRLDKLAQPRKRVASNLIPLPKTKTK